MTDTNIEWTHREGTKGVTWNPTTGCDKISPGCDHCYALTLAKRLKGMGQAKYQNDGDPRTSGPGFALTVHPDTLTTPLHWRDPRTVFVNSMSDLFHAKVGHPFIGSVFDTMRRTPQHTYQILTKRPNRMFAASRLAVFGEGCPLPNVWLGTSVESAKYVERIEYLRATPAAVRFLSLEPLLGPLPDLNLSGIDWVIIGGESGRGARPLDLGWVRDIVAQCREQGAAPFVKQLGSVWAHANGADPKGGKWEHWPADLRVREYPTAREQVPA